MSFHWKPCQQFLVMLRSTSMDVVVVLQGGPMDGQRFDAALVDGKPPARLIGSDIHRRLCGTYELQGKMIGLEPDHLLYRLREDDDYQRLLQGWQRSRIDREVENLSQRFRTSE